MRIVGTRRAHKFLFFFIFYFFIFYFFTSCMVHKCRRKRIKTKKDVKFFAGSYFVYYILFCSIYLTLREGS